MPFKSSILLTTATAKTCRNETTKVLGLPKYTYIIYRLKIWKGWRKEPFKHQLTGFYRNRTEGAGKFTENELVLGGKRSLGDLLVNVLAGFEGLFPSDDLGDTFDEDVDELHFGLAESIGVGDVPGAAG